MCSVRSCLAMATMVGVSGCAAFSPKDVADPTTLTIPVAMKEIGDGFLALQKSLEGNKIGVLACKIDVNLNLTATAGQGGTLVLDASLKPPTNVQVGGTSGLTAKAEQSNTSEGSRGNTIAIHLINPACLPKDTVGYSNPAFIGEIYKQIDESGSTVFGAGPK